MHGPRWIPSNFFYLESKVTSFLGSFTKLALQVNAVDMIYLDTVRPVTRLYATFVDKVNMGKTGQLN